MSEFRSLKQELSQVVRKIFDTLDDLFSHVRRTHMNKKMQKNAPLTPLVSVCQVGCQNISDTVA